MKIFTLAAMFVVGLALIGVDIACERTDYRVWCFLCGLTGGLLFSASLIGSVFSIFRLNETWFDKAPSDGAWKD